MRIGIDDQVPRDTMRLSGARTEEEAVDTVLRRHAARHRRGVALEHFACLSRTWDYEGWSDSRARERNPEE
ncbi:type II toxin-antitoxin system VapB family antitoxin [Nocardiopsis sp. LOL_012]|uniref:type II toxin-antitoxin system VapB family antitoxin n=1 Tax=Nocardiopsis sp. LOL_012 TaxID=3345409 RepID=UPI003A84FC29